MRQNFTKRFFKRLLWIIGILAVLVLAAYLSLAWYVNHHKKEVLASLMTELNNSIDGKLTVGDMETTFLTGFPRVSLRLRNVSLTDKRYNEHKHELLHAGDVDVAVNALALFRGTVEIRKVSIRDAAVYLYTAADGYSNSSIFKKKGKATTSQGGSYPQLKSFSLEHVIFTAENIKSNKHFRFDIHNLQGGVDFSGADWHANVSLDALAESMSFNVNRGSFIKGKALQAEFDVTSSNGKIAFSKKPLQIGDENFTVAAEFDLTDKESKYSIHIRNEKIYWDKAAELLANNIRSRLDLFKFSEPIVVSCDLVGDFNSKEDPLIYVKATVRDNSLTTPGGTIANCNFDGIFTNNYTKQKGFNDANSAIMLNNLRGEYGTVPFEMQQAEILDLDKPFAKGKFRAAFPLQKLNNLVDRDLIKFSAGNADIAVDFTADIVNYKLAKPIVAGKVGITGANISYVQRNLTFKDVAIGLDFTDKDLFIRNIVLKSGRSEVKMDGKVLNFLNLYYSAPEKIVLDWNVYSPQLHLGEFLGYLKQRQVRAKKAPKKPGNFTSELTELFEKSNVNMAMKVDKLYYKSFYATNATAVMFVSDSAITVKKAGLSQAGGTISLDGNLSIRSKVNRYAFNALVKKVDISQFFKAFDNFGMESLKSDNLKGELYAKADLSGKILENGNLMPNSMHGTTVFTLKNGTLVNFSAVKSVGKYAFPLRDMNNIVFSDLNGKFEIDGEKVTIEPMKISSTVLNLDIAGVYSFGKGTNLKMDIPLRNPKKDEDITDKEVLAKRRTRGIVLHLYAADDETGKVKIGLGKNKGKDD
jgi:hypothetical protein